MKLREILRYVPPFGPVLSLLLIGLVVLSGLLYYRAVKIQRYLEPMLAISMPRNEFTRSVHALFEKEFGNEAFEHYRIRAGTIHLNRSQLFLDNGALSPSSRTAIRKFARIFLTLLSTDHARGHISLILINARYPSDTQPAEERSKGQRMVATIMDVLFQAEPELKNKYANYFASAVQPAPVYAGSRDVIELRIIPSELLHIEVLEKLKKYAAYSY